MHAATTGQMTDRRSASVKSLSDTLFAHFQTAFESFQGLRELAEDMRILSLNAELAAGRAGAKGVAVRALTQYTRQLVSQLRRLEDEIEALRNTSSDLATQADTVLLPPAEDHDHHQAEEHHGKTTQLINHILVLARKLGGQAARIRTVSEQSNGIATNIAIEAAAAGAHESEFRTVANTMKVYIADLQTMVEKADQATRKSEDICRTMARHLKLSTA